MRLYNTLTGKKELFKPGKSKKVELFVCGITPYDLAHIGHARTYIVFDMIVKYLKQKGYGVFYLQNITDIDDKIINRAKEKRISPRRLAEQFEKEYLKDMKELKIASVTKYARATDHIKEIISQIERLLKKGYAYQINDGIYYDISKFKDYGKLSRRTVLGAEDAVSRIDESKGKKNKGDFALWKFSKAGEPKWKSPFGDGRPGWHIEDTAITEKYFGAQYDIHGGGRDLIFPHHEAEIAQMEAISDKKPLVKHWLHAGFLTVEGEKMAKSLGNFITIKDFLKQYSPRLLRFLILKNHYRTPLDYTEKAILQAEKELERIDEFVNRIQSSKSKVQNNNLKFKISKLKSSFDKAIKDDFNTPKAMAAIFELISRGNALINQEPLGRADAKNILDFFKKIDDFLGLDLTASKSFLIKHSVQSERAIELEGKLPQRIIRLAEQREKYRQEKNWQKADEAREKIEKLGWRVEDTLAGQKLKPEK